MNEYELIYESLCDAVDNGEIDAEFAEAVNDLAYDKYVTEAPETDEAYTARMANLNSGMKHYAIPNTSVSHITIPDQLRGKKGPLAHLQDGKRKVVATSKKVIALPGKGVTAYKNLPKGAKIGIAAGAGTLAAAGIATGAIATVNAAKKKKVTDENASTAAAAIIEQIEDRFDKFENNMTEKIAAATTDVERRQYRDAVKKASSFTKKYTSALKKVKTAADYHAVIDKYAAEAKTVISSVKKG